MSCTSGHLISSGVVESEPYLRYLPVMIARLMLSLKKATASEVYVWTIGEPAATAATSVRFAEDHTRDEMALNNLR